MGGVCCPTLISNTALAEKFTSYFHGFYYKGFYTSLGIALSDFWQHGRLPTIIPWVGFSYISITQFHFALATSHGVECVGPICVLVIPAGVEPGISGLRGRFPIHLEEGTIIGAAYGTRTRGLLLGRQTR